MKTLAFKFLLCFILRDSMHLNYIANIMFERALYVAADLQIADFLYQKPYSCEELALVTKTNSNALKRLMRVLELNQIFTQNESGEYIHSPESLCLCSDHPQTVRPFLLHNDPTRWNAIGNLNLSVKSGNPSFNELYGVSYFEYLKEHPKLAERFDLAMNRISEYEDELIAKALPIKGTVIDLGGGLGQLAYNMVTYNTDVCHVTVIDICHENNDQMSDDHKISYLYGNFFEPLKIDADTIILKRILHDWNDEKAVLILENIKKIMNDNTRLYIIDAVLDQSDEIKEVAAIDLLLLTIFGGKERTHAEWITLLHKAELQIASIDRITSFIHIIECVHL